MLIRVSAFVCTHFDMRLAVTVRALAVILEGDVCVRELVVENVFGVAKSS